MRIALLGSGVMSRQIAVFLALGGYDTVIWNRARRAHVPDALREEASRWGADYASLDRSIVLTDDLNELADSSLVIESVLEDPRVKSRILAEVSSLVAEDTIITTNTSALSIETLSTVVRRPERFHGLHFLNPLQKVRFVEVSPCRATSRATLDRTIELLGRWSLDYCIVPDVPGFVVNHMLFSMLTTAINLVQEEGLEPKIIDDAVTRSRILVTGPFKVADFVGLDTCLRVLTQIHERTGQPRFEPPALLEQKVMAGELGVKSGRGFYVYDEP